jgi:hypothetical protein
LPYSPLLKLDEPLSLLLLNELSLLLLDEPKSKLLLLLLPLPLLRLSVLSLLNE